MGNIFSPFPAPRKGARRAEGLANPGSFDELHRKCKDVFPQQMEGVKLIINKSLSSHFQIFPTLIGDISNVGSLSAQILHLITERIRTKAIFQTQQAKFTTWQFDAEYRGGDYTATLTLGNPDLISESVIVVAHFLQSMTSRLVLGGELVYHRRAGEEGTIVTLAGKYTALKWIATLNLGFGGAHASYYHRANDQSSSFES
ncbi:hypothetical protein Chor_005130 [Crotalus horridus]